MSRKPRKKVWIVLTVTACVILLLGATFFAVSAVSAVKNVKISNTSSGLQLKWTPVSNADFYEIYKVSSDSTKRIATVKASSYTDKSVSYNNSYRYKIRTVSGKFKSSYVYVSYKRLAAPTVTSVSLKGNAVNIKWNSVSGATGYIIYKKSVESKKWTKLASVGSDALSYTDSSSENKTSSYALKQLNGQCESALGNSKSLNAGAARQLNVRNSPYGVVLSWKKFASDKKIEIIRKVGKESKQVAIISGTEMSYIDKRPVYGKKNYYVIRAITSSGQKDENSNIASLYAVNPNRKMVALTYDDGPYAPVTESILQTLKENNARATFYVVGSRLEEFKSSLIKEAQYG
ncbi:MAG: polysaccharide deacetylase family protein, partial [Acutalibacteraceae bacterium]